MTTRRLLSDVQSSSSSAGEPMSGSGGGGGGVGGGGGGGGGNSSDSFIFSSGKKRTTAMNGIPTSIEDKSNDFLCPICFDIINEAHITKCGHTFCHHCIIKSIDMTKKCPKCNFTLTSQEFIVPNYLLNDLITKFKLKGKRNDCSNTDSGDTLKHFLASESKKLSLSDVNVMLEILNQRKMLLEAESCAAQNRLLHEFLKQLLQQKERQQSQVLNEIALIKNDLVDVEKILKEVQSNCPTVEEVEASVKDEKDEHVVAIKNEIIKIIDKIDTITVPSNRSESLIEGFNLYKTDPNSSSFMARKQRMYQHFDEFVQCYFAARSDELYFGKDRSLSSGSMDTSTPTRSIDTTKSSRSLDTFRENLIKFSKYSALRPLATLNYSSEANYVSTIVSSIEFDKDNELFAIAGVTKRIKIFDYYTAIRDAAADINYPINEMVCNSKISCVIWNNYFKEVLASSDYEGIVSIWDVGTKSRTKAYEEHDKRCWCVDFNEVDTRLLASGSDDARVKLWSLNVDHSVATIEARANVCCVKFNPKSSCHLAFGSADHCVHYYDLRNIKEPLCVFKGHKKAVSYVKFLNTTEIVSAGTDGQLKLWNINSPPYCLRSFTGHINEKNFAGLATNNDYLACGSEDNSLCVYYKGLSKQLFNLKFNNTVPRSITEQERSNDGSEFVSAVCWRKQSNIIIAGNSEGIIKILEIV
ncbi:E3 ubiquitin-protein ligase COP1-like isoform X1 [Toxorhynchites rutilus septentrionalis]|uniref:E3 ubiquitin-protein ligase COP1-like isoform X1 n=1 Tax=Toxorhynchites rutilus septentrionalis TaxID=329112 RepID=UPI00247B0DA8|nr:E3 ubiquitin-protein ligase COP1-like isoform X1 [Toxorhynchites rutilus septentrionalis]XP_055636607.1 E3 ubiquitin-protein ligase COP1-like isoform X1 [Toxorhynchites rutilus septentrionalis]